MTGFIHKKLSSSKKLSEILRTERIKLGLSLEELSLKAKISLRYLEALENGNYHLLPGKVYAGQFIKNLAKLFHLKEKTLQEIFQKENKSGSGSGKKQLSKTASAKSSKLIYEAGWLAPKTIRKSIIIILIVAFLSYFTLEIINIFTPPFLKINSPASQTITATSSILIQGQTEPETTVLINQQEILTEPSGKFSQMVDLTIGLNNFKISASKKHSKARIITISVLRQPIISE